MPYDRELEEYYYEQDRAAMFSDLSWEATMAVVEECKKTLIHHNTFSNVYGDDRETPIGPNGMPIFYDYCMDGAEDLICEKIWDSISDCCNSEWFTDDWMHENFRDLFYDIKEESLKILTEYSNSLGYTTDKNYYER